MSKDPRVYLAHIVERAERMEGNSRMHDVGQPSALETAGYGHPKGLGILL